mmetsp:Transcript_12779/g.35761  ORF Transcript_12779/g.35761 Transcript_12779/m.35761 type:complete len:183 (+) Transcript_12779:252-800(+)
MMGQEVAVWESYFGIGRPKRKRKEPVRLTDEAEWKRTMEAPQHATENRPRKRGGGASDSDQSSGSGQGKEKKEVEFVPLSPSPCNGDESTAAVVEKTVDEVYEVFQKIRGTEEYQNIEPVVREATEKAVSNCATLAEARQVWQEELSDIAFKVTLLLTACNGIFKEAGAPSLQQRWLARTNK